VSATRPNFLGIGAQKSGTTWLAEVLRSHPEVFMAHEKETHYFSEQFDRGEEWYLRHFSRAGARKAVGEFSVSYLLGSADTARRIHEFDPGMKLIAIVRDPVHRAFSHYRWAVQYEFEKGKFAEAFERVSMFSARGLYYRNLSLYWDLFPEEQILIIKYDDIAGRPREVQKKVFSFLGVDPTFVSPLTDRVVSPTIKPRSRLLERMRSGLYEFLIRTGMASVIVLIKRTRLPGLYRRINAGKEEKKRLSPEEHRHFHEVFAEDIERLARKTGLDLSDWSRSDPSHWM
jgi:hypothetical protein